MLVSTDVGLYICTFQHPNIRAREQDEGKAMLSLPHRPGTLGLRAGASSSGGGERIVREGRDECRLLHPAESH